MGTWVRLGAPMVIGDACQLTVVDLIDVVLSVLLVERFARHGQSVGLGSVVTVTVTLVSGSRPSSGSIDVDQHLADIACGVSHHGDGKAGDVAVPFTCPASRPSE